MLYRTSKDKNHPYVVINKGFLEDGNLSLKAKGLLAYCMSKKDGWVFHISQMTTVLKEGRDALNSAFNELIKFGYCVRSQKRHDDGQFSSGEYILYEVPIKGNDDKSTSEKPYTENPVTDLPTPEDPQLVNNDCIVNKEEESVNAHAQEKKNSLIEFGKYVRFSQEDYDCHCIKWGKDRVDELIEAINDHCSNHQPKGYKDYSAALRTFIRNQKTTKGTYNEQFRNKGNTPKRKVKDREGEFVDGIRVG